MQFSFTTFPSFLDALIVYKTSIEILTFSFLASSVINCIDLFKMKKTKSAPKRAINFKQLKIATTK